MATWVIALLLGAVYLIAYRVYGRRVSKLLVLHKKTKTPADRFNDGYDFVPTRKSILLAQHFSSIAAAGPIVGPIAAGLAFGWGPTLLWIIFGSIFIGASHDLCALVASVKNDARSVPELAKSYLGPTGYKLSLGFIWLCLVYVIIAFTDVTAQQFVAKEEWGGKLHEIGGGVATSSILYLILSIVLGLSLDKLKLPLSIATVIFLPLLLGIIIFGQSFPITFNVANPVMVWGVFILVYCGFASLMPMWLLLQPRGYLGGYFLYSILIVGALGLLFGGKTIEYPMYLGAISAKGDLIFPFLFITVACGACSGFHGLVCSGTTSKQLKHETDAPLIGYGGMLLEGVVAVLALTTVMIWPTGSDILSRSPSEIYATGIAQFTHAVFGLDREWGLTFGMLAFATFVYDTLDVATRLGRYLLEELFGIPGWTGRLVATCATLGLPFLYLVVSPSLVIAGKPTPLWAFTWPLFGSSNQLLAALTLLLMIVWLKKNNMKYRWVLWPAVFMFITASVALFMQASRAADTFNTMGTPALLNLVITSSLLVLSVVFGFHCVRAARNA